MVHNDKDVIRNEVSIEVLRCHKNNGLSFLVNGFVVLVNFNKLKNCAHMRVFHDKKI